MNTDERALKEFMSAYFHEDWALDAESPRDVIAEFFRDHESATDLTPIARALHNLVDGGEDDATLSRRLFREFGAYFDPLGTGESTREWLRSVADEFDCEIKNRG